MEQQVGGKVERYRVLAIIDGLREEVVRLQAENVALSVKVGWLNDAAFGEPTTGSLPAFAFDDWTYHQEYGWVNPEDDPAMPTETALLDEIRDLRDAVRWRDPAVEPIDISGPTVLVAVKQRDGTISFKDDDETKRGSKIVGWRFIDYPIDTGSDSGI